MDERSVAVTIGGQQHELLLTTRATKEITRRYGGLEGLGDKFMKSENLEAALGEVVWLLVLLSNQSISVHNLLHPEAAKPLLTEEAVELLTSPLDLADYKNAIGEAVSKGVVRNITSEDEETKNTKAG